MSATLLCVLELTSPVNCRFFSHVWNIHINRSFIYSPTVALMSCIKINIEIYIKNYIKSAPVCFGVTVTRSSGSCFKVKFNVNFNIVV